jgi:nucleotide-binding universal stress UspA family protein
MSDRGDGVVVGYDGSDHARAAIKWAAAEAARRGVPLAVETVLDYSALVGWPGGASPWLIEDAQSEIAGMADQGAQLARDTFPGLDVRAASHLGPAARTLVDLSRHAGLMVVGSRGHGPVGGVLLGSVAFTLAAHGHCPVVVVRGDGSVLASPLHEVVVGVDGSTAAGAALTFAADAAARAKARLTVVCSWTPASSTAWASAYGAAYPDHAHDEVERAHAERIAAEAAGLALSLHPGLDVRVHVTEGAAATTLPAAAADAGLLVVGSRGRGGFASLLLGSVSHVVIQAAPCPVAVVRAVEIDLTGLEAISEPKSITR